MCAALREHQWKNRLSDKQLTATLQLVHEIGELLKSGVKLPKNISAEDSKTRKKVGIFLLISITIMLGNDLFFVTLQAGVRVVRYDGCVECNKHVWHQDDKSETCPICAKPTRYAKPFVSLKYRIKNTLHCTV